MKWINRYLRCIFIALLFILFSGQIVFSQSTDSSNRYHFGAAATVTNKGISLIPTFTLGKPAAIFDMTVGGKRLSFEPQLRFALKGKPWSFIFWWRYKLINQSKLKIGIGAHPSLVFKTVQATINGIASEVLQAHRYVAAELAPNYFVTKSCSVGLYYLFSHGLDAGAVHNTHFVTVNIGLTHIPVAGNYFARFYPQLYYLSQDNKDGLYYTHTLTIARQGWPVSVQSIFNKKISSRIPSQQQVWNLSIVYSFNNHYAKR